MKWKCIFCKNEGTAKPDSPKLDPVEDMNHIIPQHRLDCPVRKSWEARKK